MPEKLSEEKVLELLERMKQGDQKAREELIIAYAGIPYQLAKKYCRGQGDLCDELVTVGYKALIRSVDRGEFDYKVGVEGCLYNRVKSRIRDCLKTEKKSVEITARHESLDTSSHDDDGEQVKEIADLRSTPEEELLQRLPLDRAIKSLSDKHRLVITLHYYHEFELAEIADLLCEPVSTIKARLHEARKKMRASLSSLSSTVPNNAESEVK